MERLKMIAFPVAALAAALILVCVFPRGQRLGPPDCVFGDGTYMDPGEALLHAVRPPGLNVSYHLPLASLGSAVLRFHAGETAKRGWIRSVRWVGALLLFSLACFLGPPAWAALAPALWVSRAFGIDPVCYLQAGFTLLVLIVAGLLVRRARAPSLGSKLLLGLALGASLVFRSALAFFPPVLAFHELVSARRSRPRRRIDWRGLLAACALPYLFLLPWLGMNYSVHGRVVPFEAGEASMNVITGALGIVPTVEGNVEALADDLPDTSKTGRVLVWAAREVLRHPLRYARACAQRVGFVLGLHPLLWALALWALWLHRGKEEYRLIGLLLAYFVGVHCLMSVERSYFLPLEPLLAALAAAPLLAIRRRPSPRAEAWGRRVSTVALACALTVALGLVAFAFGVVCAYAVRARARPPESPRALDEAIAANPADPWLLAYRGRRSLRDGRNEQAARDLEAAVRARPGDAGIRLLHAWASRLSGDPAPLSAFDPARMSIARWRVEGCVLKAEGALRVGRARDARDLLEAALGTWRSEEVRVRRLRSETDRRTLARLSSPAEGVHRMLGVLRSYRSAGERFLVARPILDLARGTLSPEDPAWHSIAVQLQDIGEYTRAVGILDRLLAARPDSSKLLGDRGLCRYLAGSVREGIADLEAAIRLDPGLLPPYLTLATVHLREGRHAEALAVCERALREGKDPVLERLIRRTRDDLLREDRGKPQSGKR
ncbi:MAG: tetratricopeptide repeat protein [Elusimicrobiota bacterium]